MPKIVETPFRQWAVRLGLALLLSALFAIGLSNSPAIQFELGYAYENGNLHGWRIGFGQDFGRAAYWLDRAAQAGHPRAQYSMGILHAHGWGVAKTDDLALEWFTRSAKNGYAPACYHLAWMYHKGDGVAQDTEKAEDLMRQAASKGMAAANLALGRFQERGEGVPANAEEAMQWYGRALELARLQPTLFNNRAFEEQATAARDALAKRVATSPSQSP